MTVESEKIILKIIYEKTSMAFNIKKGKPLAKLFQTFSERMNMDLGHLRFYYNEKRLEPSDTPLELEMTEDDVIDATLMQQGGMSLPGNVYL